MGYVAGVTSCLNAQRKKQFIQGRKLGVGTREKLVAEATTLVPTGKTDRVERRKVRLPGMGHLHSVMNRPQPSPSSANQGPDLRAPYDLCFISRKRRSGTIPGFISPNSMLTEARPLKTLYPIQTRCARTSGCVHLLFLPSSSGMGAMDLAEVELKSRSATSDKSLDQLPSCRSPQTRPGSLSLGGGELSWASY